MKVPNWNSPSLEKMEGVMFRANVLKQSCITYNLLVTKSLITQDKQSYAVGSRQSPSLYQADWNAH